MSTFRSLIAERPAVQRLLLRYVRFFLAQTLQSVACNSLHAVDERCAKGLLLAVDRANSAGKLAPAGGASCPE